MSQPLKRSFHNSLEKVSGSESRMKGNLHVRFLGGWRVVTLSGYPVGVVNFESVPLSGWCFGLLSGGWGILRIFARIAGESR
jgi:hypothetical protein